MKTFVKALVGAGLGMGAGWAAHRVAAGQPMVQGLVQSYPLPTAIAPAAVGALGAYALRKKAPAAAIGFFAGCATLSLELGWDLMGKGAVTTASGATPQTATAQPQQLPAGSGTGTNTSPGT